MPKQKKSNLPDDDFDRMYAELQAEYAAIDRLSEPTVKAPERNFERRDPRRPNLPDHTDPNYHWDRNKVFSEIIMIGEPPPITVAQFMDQLFTAAPFFVWNDFDNTKHLRGWSKLGYSFDPVTAVLLQKHELHFSLAITDIAGRFLGLSQANSKMLAHICWNSELADDDESGTLLHTAKDVKAEIITTITEGVKQWMKEQKEQQQNQP